MIATQAASVRAAGSLARRFIGDHPVESARVIERYGADQAAALLKDFPVPQIAAIAEALADDAAAATIANFDSELAAAVLAALDLDEAAALLRRMDQVDQLRMLEAMPEEQADQTKRILSFPPGTAGSLMDPKVLAVPDTLTAGEALDKVRASPRLALYYLYLVDGSSRLTGVINLRELMLAEPQAPLAEIMVRGADHLSASADQLSIVAHPGWTEFHALPVVDSNGRFVGAIRYETLRRLEGQSRTEDPSTSLAVSLGELYWLGLSGILQGMGQAVAGARPEHPEDRDAG